MNTKIIRTLIKKELLDVFRDKKTVIMMLVVPVILYPLIFIGAMQVFAAISSSMEKQDYRIAVDAEDDGAFLQALLEISSEKENSGKDEADGESYTLIAYDVRSLDSNHDYMNKLREEEIDAYVVGRMHKDKMLYDVYYMSSVTNSAYAGNIVMDVFEKFREEMTKEKIWQAGLHASEILEPILFEKQDISTNEQSLGSIMGSVLPFMLIISLLMGTMYPAIDTTAGERERGTLETILTLPVASRQLIVSKFITVATIGIISALLNILSMGGIALYMQQIMELGENVQSFDMSRFIPAILIGILAVFAFSLFISAITMCVTSFAKSYKEANNYITPLMLVVMIVGYIGFIPNLELNRTLAMIPVANICLLIKNILVFKIDYMIIAIVLFSNIAYAMLAILFLSKIYDSEAILFGDAKSSFQLFEKRSNIQKGGVPSMSDAWFVMALTIVLILYVGSMMQIKYGIAGLFGTQMIILLVALSVVWYTKKDIRLTYGFHKTGARSYLGGVFMIIGFYLINMVMVTGLAYLFPESTENVSMTFSEIMDGNIIGIFFVIAVTPAICEEMLFRGMLFHSMKARYRMPVAIGAVATIFGLYHMSLVKFIPTGLLGLLLCYMVYATGSIYPAMMMHCINNALSVFISCYPKQVEALLPVFSQDTLSLSDVFGLLGAGLLLFGVGLMILQGKHRKKQR